MELYYNVCPQMFKPTRVEVTELERLAVDFIVTDVGIGAYVSS